MVFRAAMQTTAAASLLGALLVMAAGGGCQSREAEEANTKKATEKLAKLAADYEAAEKAESEKHWAATHPPARRKEAGSSNDNPCKAPCRRLAGKRHRRVRGGEPGRRGVRLGNRHGGSPASHCRLERKGLLHRTPLPRPAARARRRAFGQEQRGR